MSDTKKRFIRVLVAMAGIMAAFNAIPVNTVEWVQTVGGWIGIVVAAAYSNSDSLLPGGKK